MARFGDEAELATFLGKLDAEYTKYAPALWQKGIKTPTNCQEPSFWKQYNAPCAEQLGGDTPSCCWS